MDFEDPEGLEEFENDDDDRCEVMAQDQSESIKKLAAQDKCVVYSIQDVECSIHEVDVVYRLISAHGTAAEARFALQKEEAAQANRPPSERLHFSVWDQERNERDELEELCRRENLKINPPF